MRKQSRWMKWIIEESDTFQVKMPWDRRVRNPKWKKRISTISPRSLISEAKSA